MQNLRMKQPADPTEELQAWGDNIRRRRLALHMSQDELAALIGVHQSSVGRWEKGEHELRRNRREQIAEALRAEPDALFPMAALSEAS